MNQPHEQGGSRLENGRFPKGVSGNPGGRRKGSVSLGTRLQRALAERPDEAEAIVQTAIARARAGDPAMLRIVLDRHDGPLAVRVEGLGEEEFVRRLVALGAVLVERVPREHHETIADAIRAAMCGPAPGEDGPE